MRYVVRVVCCVLSVRLCVALRVMCCVLCVVCCVLCGVVRFGSTLVSFDSTRSMARIWFAWLSFGLLQLDFFQLGVSPLLSVSDWLW